MIRLLIDGYNLMHLFEASTGQGDHELEASRSKLIQFLHQYQSLKKHLVHIVFDGKSTDLMGGRDRFAAIHIEFSRAPQNADDRIVEICESSKEKWLVVSNDREILLRIQRAGHESISCQEFLNRAQLAIALEGEDPENFEDELPLYPKISTQKKGRHRRAPKKKRQLSHRIKKL